MNKTCRSCGESKPVEEFQKVPGGKFGVRGKCTICVNTKRQAEYAVTEKVRRAELKRPLRERTHKPCAMCGEDKPIDRYHKSGGSIDGRHIYCMPCSPIYKQQYYARNSRTVARSVQKFKDENPRIRAAQKAVEYAVRIGKLKKEPCLICDKPKVQAHHYCYADDHFLKIQWLCGRHHYRANRMKAEIKFFTKELDSIWPSDVHFNPIGRRK